MREKNNIEENRFWPGFFLGAALGAGVIYFLQEDDSEKKEKIIQVIRDLLISDNSDRDKKVQIANVVAPKTTKHTFHRHGKAIS